MSAMKIQKRNAVLSLPNKKKFKSDTYKPSIGHKCIDITKLYGDEKFTTFDPGLGSTSIGESKITYIDGAKGVLRHRGYSIEDLVANASFLEVVYLLIWGELPNKNQLQSFEKKIKDKMVPQKELFLLLKGYPEGSHPMSLLMGFASSLSSLYEGDGGKNIESIVCNLIAQIFTSAAIIHRNISGEKLIEYDEDLSFIENFLHMLLGKIPSPAILKAIEKILILHIDHEQNASTFTVRAVGSSGANPYICIAAGIGSLSGPSHGGANEAVINMLEKIGSTDRITHFIRRAKSKSDPFKLMGFGHRVYKSYDPRARVLKSYCDELLDELGIQSNLLQVARELEKVALNDTYFQEKKLFPNVDFYSGIIYKALGIPTNIFTVLFAVARTPGWIAHWNEMIEFSDGKPKIVRPRQLYTGYINRKINTIKKEV
jgi:citrate synthase